MKADQIAYYVHNAVQADAAAKMLGLPSPHDAEASDWVNDTVSGRVRLGWCGNWQASKGQLMFNYAHGMEIELLTYISGPHWHSSFTAEFRSGMPFLSHVGYHLADGEAWPDHIPEKLLVQEMITERHTNAFLIQRGRTYHYRIYDTRQQLGVYSKFIRRIENGEVA